MACVAGFIAGQLAAAAGRAPLRPLAPRPPGTPGRAAIVFVAAATGFSLLTQAYVLGGDGAILAAQLHVSAPC